MKRISVLIAFCTFFIISCDKVTNPIIKKGGTAVGSKYITKTNEAYNGYRKVLIEDYTGQKCPNCPDAARIIKGLILKYGDTLVPIAVHQGDNTSFAAPLGINWPNDYRTLSGQAWGSKSDAKGFGIDQYPLGLINRKTYATNSPKFNKATWASIVPLAKKDPFILKLNLKTQYDTTARALNTIVHGTFQAVYANPVKLILVYLEDGIVGKQTDGSSDNEEYEFEHMLRGNLNGDAWGTDLTTNASAAGRIVGDSIMNFALPKNIQYSEFNSKGIASPLNDAHVTVVAFVYDAVTREVLQAEKVKIR